ncbi:TRAP transporter small permease [Salibacterium aidingense]|uniref:TRAP transporter small permease n=1 Tax=Salibacterium aidingense TaxID=384933 RepID=UPI0003FAFA97|nr:TRAP transporter small permease [Salibacterium aidingense]
MDNFQSASLKDNPSPVPEDNSTVKKEKSNTFFKIIDRINQGSAVLAGISLLSMMVLIVFNAIKRLYSDPVSGTVEIVGWLSAVIIIFSLGYTQLHKKHVYIDLVHKKFPLFIKRIVHILVNAVSIIFFIIAGWQIVLHGLDLMNDGIISETMRIPFYPVVLFCSIGFIGLVLVLIKETILVWKGEA